MDNVIDVCCIATPDGRAFWCRPDHDTLAQFWINWKESLPEEKRRLYAERDCFGGVVVIRMLESAYRGITTTSEAATLFPASAR